MTKRVIDIDDSLLEEAKAFFGTKTLKDTVNAALGEIAARKSRLAEIDLWLTDPFRDLRDLEKMKDAWH